MIKTERLWSLLGSARSGCATARQELFTSGGCHAFAFATALRLNGTAELMTKIAIPGDFCIFVEKRIHAWAKANSRFIDYFGEAGDEGVILARFVDKLGLCPKFVVGTKPHTVVCYSPNEIREVLLGAKKLPAGYYDDSAWLKEAIAFGSETLP